MMIFFKSVVCPSLPSFEDFNFFDLSLISFSAHICTETISTKIYGRCAPLFSQGSWGKCCRERGFNINKHLQVENFHEVSISQRLVYDYFQSFNAKLHEYIIPKELLHSCKQVHSMYEEARKKAKKIKSNKENVRKRKLK